MSETKHTLVPDNLTHDNAVIGLVTRALLLIERDDALWQSIPLEARRLIADALLPPAGDAARVVQSIAEERDSINLLMDKVLSQRADLLAVMKVIVANHGKDAVQTYLDGTDLTDALAAIAKAEGR
ncbi:hypothetical protein [Xanthobacter sediminis]